jgi:5-methylcytosine-specific restriction endonuclease McrA
MVLNEATLVLNKSWIPIDFTTVREALRLIYSDAALAVLPDDYSVHDFKSWADLRVVAGEPHIRTVSLEIKVPEIIVLANYNGIPDRRIVLTRRNLFRRDNCTCQYCGGRLRSEDATIDHVLPRSRGGKSNWINCVIACVPCNARKADRLPLEVGMALRRRPFKPRWSTGVRIPLFRKKVSWDKFVSDAYWNVELVE